SAKGGPFNSSSSSEVRRHGSSWRNWPRGRPPTRRRGMLGLPWHGCSAGKHLDRRCTPCGCFLPWSRCCCPQPGRSCFSVHLSGGKHHDLLLAEMATVPVRLVGPTETSALLSAARETGVPTGLGYLHGGPHRRRQRHQRHRPQQRGFSPLHRALQR